MVRASIIGAIGGKRELINETKRALERAPALPFRRLSLSLARNKRNNRRKKWLTGKANKMKHFTLALAIAGAIGLATSANARVIGATPPSVESNIVKIDCPYREQWRCHRAHKRHRYVHRHHYAPRRHYNYVRRYQQAPHYYAQQRQYNYAQPQQYYVQQQQSYAQPYAYAVTKYYYVNQQPAYVQPQYAYPQQQYNYAQPYYTQQYQHQHHWQHQNKRRWHQHNDDDNVLNSRF